MLHSHICTVNHFCNNAQKKLKFSFKAESKGLIQNHRSEYFMAAMLEQFRISDFLQWHSEQKLVLNPHFQRGKVWPPAARSYLIDTILKELPIPKIYFRTQINVTTKQSVREVVDGQQRLRAIIEFSEDKFVLSKVAKDFAGKKYSTLEPELQAAFLSYPIAVGQLINATDKDVFEVFSRLNSYNVQLNGPEKRHAKYQGDFKWMVHNTAHDLSALWDRYEIVSSRERIRMLADSLMAEMFGIALDGIKDGGQPKIDKLYEKYDRVNGFNPNVAQHITAASNFFLTNLAEDLKDTPLCNAPHFLMLFAAIIHQLIGIPQGELENLPARSPNAFSNLGVTRNNLNQLAAVIGSDEPVTGYEDFWNASKSSTQRIASRQVRFPVFLKALLPIPL
jgi:Protein of unknown function DUF262